MSALLPSPARAANVDGAVLWLTTAQNQDGGFGPSPEDGSDAMTTGWAMLGLEAAGRNPLDVSAGGRTPVDFLRANVAKLSSSGDLARTIVALQGAGVNVRSFAGQDLVARLTDRRAANGSFEGWPGTTAFSVIALRTAGAGAGLDKTLSWLATVQNEDGGWGDLPELRSNADVTAAVMQAMPNSEPAERGLAYLRKTQRPNGGFALGFGGVNTQSTAWAVQGMIAVDAAPGSIREDGNSALDYLQARQAADGHYAYSASKRPDPCLGYRPGAGGGGRQGVPDCAPFPNCDHVPDPQPGKRIGLPRRNSTACPAGRNAALADSGRRWNRRGRAGPGLCASCSHPQRRVDSPASRGAKTGRSRSLPPPASSSTPQPSFEAAGSDSSPAALIVIGLAAASLALGSVLLLGRRYSW